MPRHRSRSRSHSRSRSPRDQFQREKERQRESSSSHRHQKSERPPGKRDESPRSSRWTKDEKEPKSQFPMKGADIKWGKSEKADSKPEEPSAPKEKPSFATSGKLLEDTNTFRGRIIKYNEPPEAMKPRKRWRFYPFKGEEALPVMYLHRQSAYLIGSDRLVADFPVDHPSCSKQHAVLQYRLVPYTKPDGTNVRVVRPYVIDLESTNGTYLNAQKVEPRRYYELKEKDVLKFGFSSREYVLLHENTSTNQPEDEFVEGEGEGEGKEANPEANNT